MSQIPNTLSANKQIMGQYWFIANLSLEKTVEPHYYGAGAKLVEFCMDPATLRVFFNLFCKHGWNDSRIAVVGDYADDTSPFSTHGFAPVSLYELNMTTVRADLFKVGVDHRFAERFGGRLIPSVAIPKTGFYVFNLDKMEKVRVFTAKKNDTETHVAILMWLLADKSCVGADIGDFRNASSDPRVAYTCGRWAGDRIRVDVKNDRKYRTLATESFNATRTFFKRTILQDSKP